jgi:hypothetical protein
MEPFAALTDLYTRNATHTLANSALPNAPVLPFIEPNRRFRRLFTAIRHPVARPVRRPVLDVRPARYIHEC